MTLHDRSFPIYAMLVACPHCTQPVMAKRNMSYGPSDERVWSDGYMIDRMHPEYPDITRCRSCNNIFWLDRAKEIEQYLAGDPSIHPNRIKVKARFATEITISEMELYLKYQNPTREDEVAIRQKIWWRMNHFAKETRGDVPNEGRKRFFFENLLFLLERTDTTGMSLQEELRFRCEALRELGLFREALELAKKSAGKYDSLLQQIIEQCRKENNRVFEFDMRTPDVLLETSITGIQYHDFSTPKLQRKLTEKTKLILKREPENEHDKNAVAVFTVRGKKIGYIPRDVNEKVAEHMGYKAVVKAVITRVDHSKAEWERVRIAVLTKHEILYYSDAGVGRIRVEELRLKDFDE